ncbi:MAG: tetratricopeptide repeat protein [Acidobacteriota bacterium]
MKRAQRTVHRLLAAALVYALACPAFCAAASQENNPVEQGYGYLDQGDNRKAVRAFRRADRDASGRSVEALIGLATAYLHRQKFDDAGAAARRAVDAAEDPESRAAAYHLLGLALFSDGDAEVAELESAARAFEAVAANGTPTDATRFSHALVLTHLERWEEAFGTYRDLLDGDLDPDLDRSVRIKLCEGLLQRETSPGGGPVAMDAVSEKEARKLSAAMPWVQRPERLHTPQPYFGSKLAPGSRHVMIFKLLMDRYGCVRTVEPMKVDDSEMADISSAALRTWVYRPSAIGDRSVASHMFVTVRAEWGAPTVKHLGVHCRTVGSSLRCESQ